MEFMVGQRVRSRVSAQGMRAGEELEVAAVARRSTPFGCFLTYRLRAADGRELSVGNGHLVLEAAS